MNHLHMQQRADARNFVPREERRRIVLPARIRNGPLWTDACILNISSRGLMIHAKAAAEPGSYIELRRGHQMVLARVVWRSNQRIGLCSPDAIPVQDIINADVATSAVPAIAGGIQVERRSRAREWEGSRERSRAIEFMSVVAIGVALAGGLGVFVMETLANPVSAVHSALDSR